jgi:zinc D-Ala-D-Ala carboxypeptidase
MKRVICPRCWGRKNPFCDKCENHGDVDDTKLSKSFHLSEFTDSPTAQRLLLPNHATVKQVDCLVAFTRELLQPLHDELGVIFVTSGIRSPEINKAINGTADSAHLYGYAADIQPEDLPLLDVMYWFRDTKLEFDQVILEHGENEYDSNDDWVHVGWKHPSGVQRRQLLVMRDGAYSTWAP